jgi:hypothetical protein
MIFKKPFVLVMALFIAISNIGFACKVHFCGDSIASMSLNTGFITNNPEDGCCGEMEEYSRCCSNKTIQSQPSIDKVLQKTIPFEANCVAVFANNHVFEIPFIDLYQSQSLLSIFCLANGPPLFLQNCQLVFYELA